MGSSPPAILFVTSEKSLTTDELRKELLRRAKDRGLDPMASSCAAWAGKVQLPRSLEDGDPGWRSRNGQGSDSLAEVYKLYADGHEELVQGVEIAEMTPSTFKDVVAVGDTPVVFTDEFIPRVGAIFSMGLSASSNVPVNFLRSAFDVVRGGLAG